MRRPFLTARWENLLLLNYECPADLLEPLVPRGTALDDWEGTPLVSLVGFMFRDTRVHGIAFPGHRTFEEVNLRFYVRRESEDGDVRRAVVFVRELVPRRIISNVARILYNEPYLAVPMSHRLSVDPASGGFASLGMTVIRSSGDGVPTRQRPVVPSAGARGIFSDEDAFRIVS